MMNPWQKEFLNLEVGDWIVWQDIPIETADGTVLVIPGMKGKVISLHDGFHMDTADGSVPPKAVVEFESGMNLMVDAGMEWGRIGQPGK